MGMCESDPYIPECSLRLDLYTHKRATWLIRIVKQIQRAFILQTTDATFDTRFSLSRNRTLTHFNAICSNYRYLLSKTTRLLHSTQDMWMKNSVISFEFHRFKCRFRSSQLTKHKNAFWFATHFQHLCVESYLKSYSETRIRTEEKKSHSRANVHKEYE